MTELASIPRLMSLPRSTSGADPGGGFVGLQPPQSTRQPTQNQGKQQRSAGARLVSRAIRIFLRARSTRRAQLELEARAENGHAYTYIHVYTLSYDRARCRRDSGSTNQISVTGKDEYVNVTCPDGRE